MKKKTIKPRNTVRKSIDAGRNVHEKIQAAIYGMTPIDSWEKELAATWATVRRFSKESKLWPVAKGTETDSKKASLAKEMFIEARDELAARCASAMLNDDPQFFYDVAAGLKWYKRNMKGQKVADEKRLKMLGCLSVNLIERKTGKSKTAKHRPLSTKEIREAHGVESVDKNFYRDLAELRTGVPSKAVK